MPPPGEEMTGLTKKLCQFDQKASVSRPSPVPCCIFPNFSLFSIPQSRSSAKTNWKKSSSKMQLLLTCMWCKYLLLYSCSAGCSPPLAVQSVDVHPFLLGQIHIQFWCFHLISKGKIALCIPLTADLSRGPQTMMVVMKTIWLVSYQTQKKGGKLTKACWALTVSQAVGLLWKYTISLDCFHKLGCYIHCNTEHWGSEKQNHAPMWQRWPMVIWPHVMVLPPPTPRMWDS